MLIKFFKLMCTFIMISEIAYSNYEFNSFVFTYSSGVPYCSKMKDYTGSLSIFYQYGLSGNIAAASAAFAFKMPNAIFGVNIDGCGMQKVCSCGFLFSL